MDLEEHNVTRFEASGRAAPTVATALDYDLHRLHAPRTSRVSSQGAPSGVLERSEWFEHHGPYGESQPSAGPGPILEQLRRDAARARCRSVCRRIAPGRVFDLEGDDDAAKGAHAVVDVSHRADVNAPGRGRAVYENRFTVVPEASLYRPARPPRRVHQVLETATVVGPLGEEIHTDALGRIKVQFHWDREGQRDDRASCWIRVSQVWAGAGWGGQFIPRVGMEVLVAFLQGDVDRPMVIGCVENATHLAPFKLPEHRTRSGIKTSSVGAPGFNEFSFEDRAGAEQIRVRAQRNLSVDVVFDSDTNVAHDASLTVGGALRVRVHGDQETVVNGEANTVYTSDARARTDGNLSEKVAEDMSVDVGANYRQDVAGSSSSSVGGDRVPPTWSNCSRTSELWTTKKSQETHPGGKIKDLGVQWDDDYVSPKITEAGGWVDYPPLFEFGEYPDGSRNEATQSAGQTIKEALDRDDVRPMRELVGAFQIIARKLEAKRPPITDVTRDPALETPRHDRRMAPPREISPLPPRAAVAAPQQAVPSYLNEPTPMATRDAGAPVMAFAIGVPTHDPLPRPARRGIMGGTGEIDNERLHAGLKLPFAQPTADPTSARRSPAAQPANAQPASAQPASAQPASAQPASAQPAQTALETFARLTAALAAGRRRDEVLSSFGMTDESHRALAEHWGERMLRDPSLRVAFDELMRTYRGR